MNALTKSEQNREIQPLSVYEMFAQMVRDPSIDPLRIAQFMEIQERAERRQAEKDFIAAFSRLKFPAIQKTAKGNNSFYAPYEEIQSVIDPILSAEGFTLTFTSGEITERTMPIFGKLSHVAGHSEIGRIDLPRDKSGSMNEIQGSVSTTSYGQRALAKMMLNLRFIGSDKDGVGRFLDEHQTNQILDMFAACGMDSDLKSQAKFLDWMGVESVSDIQQKDYGKAMNALRTKLKAIKKTE